MLLQQLNRSDAEKVFIIAQNTAGETVSQGALVCFNPRVGSASLGNAVAKPVTSNLGAFAGCMDSDTAADAYGLVQVFGFRASVACAAAGINAAVLSAAGHNIGPITGSYSGSSNAVSGVGIVLMDFAVSNTGWASGLIRAL